MQRVMKFLSLTLVLALLGVVVFAAVPAASAKQATAVDFPISVLDSAGNTLEGTLTVERFVRQGNQIVAEGLLNGTLTDAAGNILETFVDDVFSSVVGTMDGTCEILNLVLGPIHLDLLGLVIDTNEIVLTITAEQGSGNLLGNLLCAVAGLLDNPGNPLSAITNLLNQILAALG